MSSRKLPSYIQNAYMLLPENKRPDPEEFIQYMRDMFKEPVRVSEWKGYRMFPGLEAETAKYCYEHFVPHSGDVVVATCGRTGTHWIQEILRQIIFCKNQNQLKAVQRIASFFSHLEQGPVSKYKVLENLNVERRCLSTHLPAELFNFEKFRKYGAKVFYVIRNPKDQAVSWCKFVSSQTHIDNYPLNERYPKDEKLFYDSYISGEQHTFAKPGEGYLEHVRDWYKHKDDPNVMILMYEDIKQNLEENIQKIANFLEVNLSDEDVVRIVDNVSFLSMKNNTNFGDKLLSKRLFRKGEVGTWVDHLSKEQSDLIDRKVEKVLGDTDVKFIYSISQQCTQENGKAKL